MSVGLFFYYRDGCHLCEELAALLYRCWPDQAAEMEWRDVDEQPEWRDAHGQSIPVLVLDGETVCSMQPDVTRIEQYFGPMVNPV